MLLVNISSASQSDLDEILALLTAVNLPHDGVRENLSSFLVMRNAESRLIGCAGLECYGDIGLLRSVAISPEIQKAGIGSRLTAAVIEDAASIGIKEVVLLTTTARDFFGRHFGFVEVERDEYEHKLAESPEWRLPRCSSAAFMRLALTAHASYSPAREEMHTGDHKRVLFLCTGNSARSQMAEGVLRQVAGDLFEVASAGLSPSFVRPEAIKVMHEIGIDISGHRSKSVDEFSGEEFDYVITVCDNANEQCPVFPGNTKRIHWSFDDPASAKGDESARLAVFRKVRDEILNRLRLFSAAIRTAEP